VKRALNFLTAFDIGASRPDLWIAVPGEYRGERHACEHRDMDGSAGARRGRLRRKRPSNLILSHSLGSTCLSVLPGKTRR
jgi:hypothetical protein